MPEIRAFVPVLMYPNSVYAETLRHVRLAAATRDRDAARDAEPARDRDADRDALAPVEREAVGLDAVAEDDAAVFSSLL